MDNKDVIKGHIKDLSLRTYNNEYITHTNFWDYLKCQML